MPTRYRYMQRLLPTLLLSLLAGGALADTFDMELRLIQQEWATANYSIADDGARRRAFEALSRKAAAFTGRYPDRAEPLVWEGIVLSTYAGVKGGLGALGLAKQARERLEAALLLDPAVLDGSAYTSLGTLFFKVPGWPLGFGDHDKAGEYLRKALAISPGGIDANYFYGEFLYEQGEYRQALEHLRRSLAAPPRPGRELADAGRRDEIRQLIGKVERKLTSS